jgi:ABC-2 type transport system permease protein
MNRLVRAEALKLRTLRLTWVLSGVAVALAGVVGFAMVKIGQETGQALDLTQVARGPAPAAWFVGVVVAVIATAGEFEHRTLRTTLLHHPRRVPVLVAKALVSAAYGALLSLAAATAAATAGVVSARVVGMSLPAGSLAGWTATGAVVLLGALWGLLATGLGTLTRSTAMAVAAVLVWRLVLEGLVPIVTGRPEIVRWLPGGASDAAVGLGGDRMLPAAGGAAVFAAYALAGAAAAAVVLLRRDPT